MRRFVVPPLVLLPGAPGSPRRATAAEVEAGLVARRTADIPPAIHQATLPWRPASGTRLGRGRVAATCGDSARSRPSSRQPAAAISDSRPEFLQQPSSSAHGPSSPAPDRSALSGITHRRRSSPGNSGRYGPCSRCRRPRSRPRASPVPHRGVCCSSRSSGDRRRRCYTLGSSGC